ncbi:MAG: hypothetical protein LBP21_01240 [Synergistaceae bacterium]|nr:hypothetical protein [Synergistaceae bacterium]
MEKAYALLGVYDFASLEEIEEAYRSKKHLYDPVRFAQGSSEWQFVCAQNKELDHAYEYAATRALHQKPPDTARQDLGEAVYGDLDEGDAYESSPLSELVDLSFVCPLAVYFIQLAAPGVLPDLLPGGGKSDLWLLTLVVLGLSYLPSLLTRFVLLKRPVESFGMILLLFPLTLCFADLCFSLILRFSPLFYPLFSPFLPSYTFGYVPVFYLTGWSLFILLYAHCTILKMSFCIKKRLPLFRRIAAYTLTLVLSVTMSVLLSMAINIDIDIDGQPSNSSAFAESPPAEDRPLQFSEADI